MEKNKLKNLLRAVNKVNITINIWTLGQKVSYMVVTCPFIDSDWVLQKRVLNFCNASPQHYELIIFYALKKCFTD
jgi:hypothetical protein